MQPQPTARGALTFGHAGALLNMVCPIRPWWSPSDLLSARAGRLPDSRLYPVFQVLEQGRVIPQAGRKNSLVFLYAIGPYVVQRPFHQGQARG